MAVDFHGRLTLASARRIAPLLEPLRPFFIEEPVVLENSHLIAQLAQAISILIATGSGWHNRQDFLPVFQAGIAVAPT